MSRESFVFYRSFWLALQNLKPVEYKNVVDGIARYALDGIEPELEGVGAIIFQMAKPQIDANNRRLENGKKGGRPKKQKVDNSVDNDVDSDGVKHKTIGFETENHRLSSQKPNVNVNDNVNVNVNENVNNNVNENEERKREKENHSAFIGYLSLKGGN